MPSFVFRDHTITNSGEVEFYCNTCYNWVRGRLVNIDGTHTTMLGNKSDHTIWDLSKGQEVIASELTDKQ